MAGPGQLPDRHRPSTGMAACKPCPSQMAQASEVQPHVACSLISYHKEERTAISVSSSAKGLPLTEQCMEADLHWAQQLVPAASAARLQLWTGGSWWWDPLPPQREAPLPGWLRQSTAAPRQGLPLEHLALPEWEQRLLLARSCTAVGQADWSRWKHCSPPPAQ